MNEMMKQNLISAYNSPSRKFCFYTGSNNKNASKILGKDDWDWTPQPTVNIDPYYWNTHTIALAFGCELIFTSEGKEWIKPLLSDPQNINQLKIPNVYSGRTGEILELMNKALDKYPEDHLIRLPDIQSPLGVAELIMGDSLYPALLTNPEEIHQLLEKISEFIIIYINSIKQVLKDRYNPSCHPQVWSDPEGYYISDDANSLVSPEMHEEFSVDYINRITRELGPVFYHTCTWTGLYLDNIRKVENKKLVNWSIGTSMDPAKIIAENSGKVLMAPHIGEGSHREESLLNEGLDFHDESELVEYLLNSMLDNSTLYLRFEDSIYNKPETFKKIYNLLKERAYTPG